MRTKFFIRALTVCLLLTLFSCGSDIKSSKNGETILPPSTSIVPGYEQRLIEIPTGMLYEIVTPKDTFLVFGKYQTGMVLLKHSPVK